MKRGCGAIALGALLIAGCHTAPRRAAPAAIPPPPTSVAALAAAIAADAKRSEHEADPAVREQLAEDADRDARACLAIAPLGASCLYYRAVAFGLGARAHPARAGELLKSMLEALKSADAVDPGYDHAGPSRVRALVLIRAPGWPLGPGDPDAGVIAARRAVTLDPDYPPNRLALADALSKTGKAQEAHDNFQRARELAQTSSAPDSAQWLRDADQGLRAP